MFVGQTFCSLSAEFLERKVRKKAVASLYLLSGNLCDLTDLVLWGIVIQPTKCVLGLVLKTLKDERVRYIERNGQILNVKMPFFSIHCQKNKQ
mgnify:CR=1 FL=1